MHGDIKPSNVMLKRTGNAKIVDIGSAFEIDSPPSPHMCTPAYAAPEMLERNECTPLSDLASLGLCTDRNALGSAAVLVATI